MWNNEPRESQRVAVTAAMATFTLGILAAAWATLRSTQLLGRTGLWRSDRWHELEAAAALYVVLMAILVWLGFIHRPRRGVPTRPLPSPGLLGVLAAVAGLMLVYGDPLTSLSAVLLGGMFTAVAWVFVLVVSRARAEALDPPADHREAAATPDTPDSAPVAVVAPNTLAVRPRDRWWWFWGWVAGALFWAGMGIASRFGPYQQDPDLPITMTVAVTCCAVASLGLRMGLTADESGIHLTDLVRRRTVPWSELLTVELEPVVAEAINLGRFRLVCLTVDGRRVPVIAPTGSPQQGGALDVLRAQLLAMRDRHAGAP
ncbi:hypothetical protein GCM10023168_22150 [Fodinibacter luteus]|uniref:PH domain-containing protein n=1 Tax=Fodinibacter luteus TaxID=552064 RepID=A0ABP8KHG0_9MICO